MMAVISARARLCCGPRARACGRISGASVALEVVPKTRVVHVHDYVALPGLVRPLLLEPVLALDRAVRILSRKTKRHHANRYRHLKVHIVQERLPVVHGGELPPGVGGPNRMLGPPVRVDL